MRRLLLLGITWMSIGVALPAKAQIHYRFENISSDQGLSNGTINAIIQDTKGFMFFGTNQGLNRFDGFKFKVFFAQSGNVNAISDNSVRSLLEDTSGDIWVGTDGGLNKFNPITETFQSFKALADSFGISNQVMDILQDHAGNLWLATFTYQTRMGGLVLFNQEKNTLEKFNENGVLDYIKDIEVDDYGNLWLASSNGITIFDPLKRLFVKQIRSEANNPTGPISNNITTLFREKNGVIWATTYSNAVTKITYTRNLDLTFENIEEIIRDKKGNPVKSMIKDLKGNIWISTFEGIGVYNSVTGKIFNIRARDNDPYTLKENGVNLVFEDRSGTIWIGHGTVGISKIKNNKGFHVLTKDSDQQETLAGDNVMAIHVDKEGTLWANIVDGGIHKIDFQGNYHSYPRIKIYTVPKRIINAITSDQQGRIWIGSEDYIAKLDGDKFITVGNQYNYAFVVDHQNNLWGTNSQQLFRVENKNANITYSISLPDSRLKSKIKLVNFSQIIEDYSRRVWTTNWQGEIFCYDTLQSRFFIPEIDISTDTTFKDTRISTFLVDKKDHFWSATLEGLGKYKIVKSSNGNQIKLSLEKVFRERDGLTTKDGISNLYTAAIEEDKNGNIWLAQVGLSVLNPETNQIKKFDLDDGLPSNTFAFHSSSKLKNGYLAFGTTNGICIFHPDSIQDNAVLPKIVITDFQVFHSSVSIQSQNPDIKHNQFTLPQSITYTNEFTIAYDMNVLGFEFAAMDFKAPQRNQYAYQMVGFDKDWVYSGNKNTTTYTNLEPGTYTFRIKGSNNDGIWNEQGVSLKITILPPPWKTWWAYVCYSIGFVLLLLAGRNEIVKRERLKTKAKLKEAEAEKYHEMDTLKSRFFANISHEFRTPLTLLLGPLEKRLSIATEPNDKAELSIMHRNASRLLTLVNQLLDLSRLEAGTLALKVHKQSLNNFIPSIASQFSSMADSKAIHFEVRIEHSVELYFDPDKLEKIITNLLSNAFKFTPSGGSIIVSISQHGPTPTFDQGFAEIKITDSGQGIEKEHLGRIFDRFYQVDTSSTRKYEGSGIGLALTKELVELHYGTIGVVSTLGTGTSFSIQLPLGNAHLKTNDIQETNTEVPPSRFLSNTPFPTGDHETLISDGGLRPTVLIVEDNADLRFYLSNSLQEKYKVHEAADGEQGLATACEVVPDLIISDLMMPRMDGLQLCERLKADERTSHIPIILLTAKTDIETKLDGLHLGADDYMAKPFDAREFQARISNLIENRRVLQEKFSKKFNLSATEIQVESLEDRFLKKVKSSIETRMSDPAFGVESLAEEVAMSTIQVYRKLKAITGQTPNDLIRNIRLERAASLLRQHAGNVSEVADQVGFNNLSYFSKCFREKYGVSPSEFK